MFPKGNAYGHGSAMPLHGHRLFRKLLSKFHLREQLRSLSMSHNLELTANGELLNAKN
jgi:hypothetical protein